MQFVMFSDSECGAPLFQMAGEFQRTSLYQTIFADFSHVVLYDIRDGNSAGFVISSTVQLAGRCVINTSGKSVVLRWGDMFSAGAFLLCPGVCAAGSSGTVDAVAGDGIGDALCGLSGNGDLPGEEKCSQGYANTYVFVSLSEWDHEFGGLDAVDIGRVCISCWDRSGGSGAFLPIGLQLIRGAI